jgi:hypothetical protein
MIFRNVIKERNEKQWQGCGRPSSNLALGFVVVVVVVSERFFRMGVLRAGWIATRSRRVI